MTEDILSFRYTEEQPLFELRVLKRRDGSTMIQRAVRVTEYENGRVSSHTIAWRDVPVVEEE